MKIRITDPGLAGYSGPLGTLMFENGVSVQDASERDIQRLAGCFAVANHETGEEINLGANLHGFIASAVCEPAPMQNPTPEQFKEMQEQALKERIVNAKADEYGAILSEDNIVDDKDAQDLIVDPELSQQASGAGNDFNGSDDDDEEDMSDLMAAEAAALGNGNQDEVPSEENAEEQSQQAPSETKADPVIEQSNSTPAAEFVADGDAPVEKTEKSATKVWNREELEAIADTKGISGLRDIADPLNVRSKKITELIEGILKVQGS